MFHFRDGLNLNSMILLITRFIYYCNSSVLIVSSAYCRRRIAFLKLPCLFSLEKSIFHLVLRAIRFSDYRLECWMASLIYDSICKYNSPLNSLCANNKLVVEPEYMMLFKSRRLLVFIIVFRLLTYTV